MLATVCVVWGLSEDARSSLVGAALMCVLRTEERPVRPNMLPRTLLIVPAELLGAIVNAVPGLPEGPILSTDRQIVEYRGSAAHH